MQNTPRSKHHLGPWLLETLFFIIVEVSQLVSGTPLPLGSRAVDPSSGTWVDPIAGVGPLILLVGERSTKQVLQNVRGLYDAFGLATAPLGLISLVTSLIRLCGVHQLRAFIGYELAARVVVGLEVTRVNCAGVHAELMNGYVVRKAAAEPQNKAIAAVLFEEELVDGRDGFAETLAQIKACEAFEREKARLRVPEDVVSVRWCLGIVTEMTTEKGVGEVVEMMADATGVDRKNQSNAMQQFQGAIRRLFPCRERTWKCRFSEAIPGPPHLSLHLRCCL
jgi:hypothetical protein